MSIFKSIFRLFKNNKNNNPIQNNVVKKYIETYNNSFEIKTSNYLLPDDDNEKDRLHDQNWLIEHIFQSKFCVNLSKELENGINVLDSGCGPGTWMFDMATEYPNSLFYGLDINFVFPNNIKPKNCLFYNCDITDQIKIDDIKNINNYFNYVRQRLLSPALKYEEWNDVIKKLKNITTINGWLEFIELDLIAYNSGPKYKELNEKIVGTMKEMGFRTNIAKELKQLLEQNKLTNIEQVTKKIYLNNNTNIISKLFYNDIKKLYIASKPWLENKLDLKGEIYETYVENAMDECKTYNTYYVWYCVYGKKIENTYK